MTQKKKTQQQRRKQAGVAELARRHRAIVAVSAVGAVAAGLGTALGLGWFDRFLTKDNAEHEVPDLAADAPVPGTTRAPEAFRPDPTAPVPASERDGLRPATGPSPTLSADRGEVANQTGAANG